MSGSVESSLPTPETAVNVRDVEITSFAEKFPANGDGSSSLWRICENPACGVENRFCDSSSLAYLSNTQQFIRKVKITIGMCNNYCINIKHLLILL